MSFTSYMDAALDEARAAGARGEVPVGAVVVGPGGEIVARAGNRTRELADPKMDPHGDLEAADRARILGEALARLSEPQRLVLLLRHQRDLSYEEIALSLDVPLGTVKARIHRAREALRKILERDFDLGGLLP